MDAIQRFNQTASGFDSTVNSLRAYANSRMEEAAEDARTWLGEKAAMATGLKQEQTEALGQVAIAAQELPSAIGKVRKYMNRNAAKNAEDDAAAAAAPEPKPTVADLPKERVYQPEPDEPGPDVARPAADGGTAPTPELEPDVSTARDGGSTPSLEEPEEDIGGETPDIDLDDISFDVPEGGFGSDAAAASSKLPSLATPEFSEQTGHLIADRPLLKTLDLQRAGFPTQDAAGNPLEVDGGTSQFTLGSKPLGTDGSAGSRIGADTGGGGWMRQPDRGSVGPDVQPTAARRTTYTTAEEGGGGRGGVIQGDEPRASSAPAAPEEPEVPKVAEVPKAAAAAEEEELGGEAGGEAAGLFGGEGAALLGEGGLAAAAGEGVLAAASAAGPLGLAVAGIGMGLADLFSPGETAPKPESLAPSKISLASQHQLTFASLDGISDAPSPGAF